MIEVSRRRYGLPYRIVWFSTPRWQLWPPTVYYQCPEPVDHGGWVKRPFHTHLSALEGTPETWLTRMNSTTRNEVKQATKLGMAGGRVSLKDFVSFFNQFAHEKQIAGTSETKLVSLGDHLWLTEVRHEGKPLAMHALVIDAQAGRARLLLSGSARFADSSERTLIGKANRWLHWWEMAEAKNAGLAVYDWGGYAKDTTDESKQGINKFKEAFGGTPTEEFHYYPFFLAGLAD